MCVCLCARISPETLDLWLYSFACVIYSSYGRFLRKFFFGKSEKKKKFRKNVPDLFFYFQIFLRFKNFFPGDFFSSKAIFSEIFFAIFLGVTFTNIFSQCSGEVERSERPCESYKKNVYSIIAWKTIISNNVNNVNFKLTWPLNFSTWQTFFCKKLLQILWL